LDGVTVNGKPLREHIKEAPVPEIKEIMKAAINIYRSRGIREKHKSRVERVGRCHHYTKEEVQRVMDTKMPLVDTILTMLTQGRVTTESVHEQYKKWHPEATLKNSAQAVSRLAMRLGKTVIKKERHGKVVVYGLRDESLGVEDLKNLYHSGPPINTLTKKEVSREQEKLVIDINININWR
jgi:pyruvate kinase